jgi:hypothetical protein
MYGVRSGRVGTGSDLEHAIAAVDIEIDVVGGR